MFDIFNQHWTLLIVAAVAFRVVEAILSEESSRLRWYSLLGFIVIFYGFDLLISTGIIVMGRATIQFINLAFSVIILILFLLPLVSQLSNPTARWWVWLIPLGLALTAFGADWIVKTDLEKIEDVINTGIEAAQTESTSGIEALIASDYQDSYHYNKDRLIRHCSRLFSEPLIEQIINKGLNIDIDNSKASAILTVLVKIDKKSSIYRQYFQPAALVTLRLELKKQPDKKWLFNSAEPIEVNQRRVNWNIIR